MKKLIIWIILISCLSFTIYAQPLKWCNSVEDLTSECSIVTPPIFCDEYNYTVYNRTGTKIINEQNLTLLNDQIYYFNFSEGIGDYEILLCDGTVTYIKILNEDEVKNMSWTAIVGCLVVMTLCFGIITFLIQSKDLKFMKSFFFLMFVVNSFLLGFIPFLISLHPALVSSFNIISVGYLTVNGFALIFFIWSYGYYLITRVFKQDKGEDEY